MATFGKLTTGGQNDEIFAGQKYVSAYTLVTDVADISKLTIDVDGLGAGGAGDVVLAAVIYDDIAGQPGNLVAYGNNVTITHTGAGAGLARSQKDFPISATLEPGVYWLGLVYISGTSQGARYWADFSSGSGRHNGGGITDPFGTGTNLDENVAVFATYTIAVPAAYSAVFKSRRLMPMLQGPGRDTIMGMYGATGAKRSIDAELQQEIRLNYEPAPLVPADVVITAPTASEVITANPYLVTASVTGSPAPDHLQFEISADGGTTWQRLSAWNPLPPYETNFNTWRFPNGSYKLRARIYGGSDESSLLVTSPVVDFTINLAAGTVRDVVGGVGTLSAAVTASADGDTIRLDGTLPDEGSTISVNKRVKIIQKPGGGRAILQSRIRLISDGIYSSEVDYIGRISSPEPEGKGIVVRGTPSNPINISSSGAGIGFQDASTIPFDADGAFDTLIENANIFDCGNRTTEINQAHGIYAQNSTRLFVRETIFNHNAARQIQLYPQSIQATIYKCALYDSEQGVLFGGDTSTGGGMGDPSGARQFQSSYCKVELCIVGKGGGDDGSSTDALIFAYWGNGVPPGPGNIVLNNFMHDPPTAGGGAGEFIDTSLGGIRDAGGNIFSGSTPGYTNAGAANFLLVGGANALGYGPDRIQPGATTPVSSTSLAPFEALRGIVSTLADPLEATTAVLTTSLDAMEATSGVAAGSADPLEATQGIAATAGDPLEALTALVTSALAPLEALQAIAASGVDPLEATQGLASIGSDPFEAVKNVAAPLSDPFEAVQGGIAASALLPFEALQGVAQALSDAIEATGGVAATATDPLEALRAITSPSSDPFEAITALATLSSDPFESSQGLATVAALPLEALAGIVQALTDPFEATGGVASTGGDPYEAAGAALVAVSNTSQLPFEATQAIARALGLHFEAVVGVASASTDPFEAASQVSAVSLVSLEALQSVLTAITSPFEAGRGIAQVAIVPLEALTGVASARSSPYEAVVLIGAGHLGPFDPPHTKGDSAPALLVVRVFDRPNPRRGA